MKTKNILIVEDKQDEVDHAKDAALAAGYKPIVAKDYKSAKRLINKFAGKCIGIITDLHFPSDMDSKHAEYGETDPEQAAGFAVLLHALNLSYPIVICSDMDHHFGQWKKDVVAQLEQMTQKTIPFLKDKKNWERAIQELEELIK